MSEAVISMRYAHWLWPCLGRDDVRHFLTGFSIEPSPKGGCVLVATDGHVLMAVHDVRAVADRPLIWKPSRALARAASAEVDKSVTIGLAAPWGEAIEGVFVDWRKVVKVPQAGGRPVEFNIWKLMAFRNVLAVHERAPVHMRVFGGDIDGRFGAIVTHEDHPEFFGLTMPVKTSFSSQWITPEWAQRGATDTPSAGSGAASQEAAP